MNFTDSPFSLAGRTVLIAGGAGYLARPVCELAARSGANICIADINADNLQQAVSSVKTANPAVEVLGVELDIGDEASINACVDACVSELGGLHGLVNATFGSTGKTLEDLTADDFDRTNHLNLTGTFLLARKAAGHMEAGASMVQFSSMYGLVAPNPANYPEGLNPNPIEYGAGKAGMAQMVRYLAAHYGPKDIRVNGIAPGPFPKPNTTGQNEEFLGNLRRETMLGRTGEQHETAGTAVFLLSAAASYISGQIVSVDGGWTAW